MSTPATNTTPAARHFTDPPDFTTTEAVVLVDLSERDHPWPRSRHLVTDENLHLAAHNLRQAAFDPRLPKPARQWLWHLFTLVWKAREGLEQVSQGLAKHHDAERRQQAAAAMKRRAEGDGDELPEGDD